MISPEGGSDGRDPTSMRRPSRRFAWWALPLGAVVAAGTMHVLVLLMILLFDEEPKQAFGLVRFALAWMIGALTVMFVLWWERRSRRRRLEQPMRRWRDDVPRWVAVTDTVLLVGGAATWFAVFTTASDRRLLLPWADALAGFAFVLIAIAGRLAERYEVPEAHEAAS
ncbi:hypothetical protein [Micromonospora sp. NBC_01796]|uniref:hypothetical protein n=1 Tax=Micromonospora sp. NBC_01796 TaxID=2975987 RepID=UPI002DDBFDA8|nr:hypothetical protein [Micromonospora sp. NBC_01796]WSA83725.1 hypothetical protein OIE47_25525 [Micromonospora sp. NBC_01796]